MYGAETMNRPAAVGTLQLENDRVRVTRWSFAPGAATGFHRHEHDYVVVPLTTGPLLLLENGEEREARLTVGGSYFRPAGVEHDVVNASDGEFVFVEIELKSPTGQS
jgi:quercetin dioxygenase-like cupin family protein